MGGGGPERRAPGLVRLARGASIYHDTVLDGGEFERPCSGMSVEREGALRRLAAIQQAQRASRGQTLIARMTGVMERLAAYVIARQQPRDHLAVALWPAIEQRHGAIAMTEEAQHRRHAVMGVA